jgi:superfamily II DNA or RNA helicase
MLAVPYAPSSPRELLDVLEAAGPVGGSWSTREWRRNPPRLAPSDLERFHRACLWRGDLGLRELLVAMDRGPGMGAVEPTVRARVLTELARVVAVRLATRTADAAHKPPAFPASAEAIEAWATGSGIGGALELLAAQVGLPRDRASSEAWYGRQTLRQVVQGDGEGPGRPPPTPIRQETAEAAWAMLSAVAIDAERATALAPAIPEGGMGRVVSALLAAADAIALEHRLAAPADLVCLTSVELDGDAGLDIPGGFLFRWGLVPRPLGRVRLGLRRDGTEIRVLAPDVDGQEGAMIPVVRQAVLRAAAVALAEGSVRARVRERLEELFEPAPWGRALARIDGRLSRAIEAEASLGWRISHVHGRVVGVEPVQVAASGRGRDRLGRLEGQAAFDLATSSLQRERVRRWFSAGGTAGGGRDVYLTEIEAGKTRTTGPVPLLAVSVGLRVGAADDGLEVKPILGGRAFGWPEVEPRLRDVGDGPAGLIERDGVWWLDVDGDGLEVLRALGAVEGRFPGRWTEELVTRLPEIGRHIEIVLDEAVQVDDLEPDLRLHLQLEQVGTVLQAVAESVPVPGGPAHPPGEGAAAIYVQVDGRVVRARRDLAAEAELWRRVVRAAGTEPTAGGVLQVEGTSRALPWLSSLRGMEGLAVRWVGRPMRVRRVGLGGLSVGVRAQRGALDLFGGLGEGDDRVGLGSVLDAVRRGESYVPLGDGSWVELEAAVVEALSPLARVLEGDDEALALHPVHAPLVEELRRTGISFDAPEAWFELLHRLESAAVLDPDVPEALGGTLRPYQREGFAWLTRLTAWGAGAVLADDMGLGKTIQAITWLLRHADEGPTLVVAPTSVVSNWQAELAKFAPILRVVVYHGPDRAGLLRDLGPRVVVLTSYAIVARDGDRLALAGWGQLVLDEAQAIKNADTARARAVSRIPAPRRVALTGTPLENHTGELWAVLGAVAPGLLGSWSRFRERFAVPIERNRDPRARDALARVIRPFVLRRLKREVEQDLPEKIEVNVAIGLSPGERLFYRGLRDAALASLAARKGGGSGHLHVLAAITRLRRAACDPRLVDPDVPLVSSKLTRLREMVATLRESGHRVLVFSQFVGLLSAARAVLEPDGVRCAWLDGRTPAAARAEAVASFQAGAHDVFLISLKAGGTGLNLTAADVVIHLDPWWNPAVEDQATDRAHRIGQQRAVTVYRLVAEGTIEAAILSLHAAKRSLVADVLEGTSAAGSLQTEDLLALLRDASSPVLDEEEDEEAPANGSLEALSARLATLVAGGFEDDGSLET